MNSLLEKIENKSAIIGIIGLGYVGLPLAVEFAKSGFNVIGFDLSLEKIEKIKNKINYIQDVSSEDLRKCVEEKKLTATNDFSKLKDVDCVSICVPTPLRKTKDPDMSYIISAVEKIKLNLHPHMLIVLESTTYPGTTDELILNEILKNGYKIGENIFLAFSPERVDPGNPIYKTYNTPKVIGGVTPNCLKVASAMYSKIIEKVVPVSSTKAAEMVKLLENTFRAVNIGLVNEVALMCDRLNIDVWEVIEAAATKPFGFMKFLPGPGLGGHCIPIDPHYLSWKLRSLNYNARFIELAGDINSHMPDFVVQKLGLSLNKFKKPFKGSHILLLGMAYKKDVNDLRESPSLEILQLLLDYEAVVCYNDPYIPEIKTENYTIKSKILPDAFYIKEKFSERYLIPENGEPVDFEKMDAMVITTNHSCYNIEKLVKEIEKNGGIIFDCRNATKDIKSGSIFKL